MTDYLPILFGFGAVAFLTMLAIIWRCVERMRERAPDPWERYGR